MMRPARKFPAADWRGPEAKALLRWFADAELPSEPFQLTPWIVVTDPSRFYEVLRSDIASGPGGNHVHRGFDGSTVIDTLRLLRRALS